MLNTHRPTTVSEHIVVILYPLYRKTLVVLEKGIAGIYLYLLYYLTSTDVPAQRILHQSYLIERPEVINQRSWYIYISKDASITSFVPLAWEQKMRNESNPNVIHLEPCLLIRTLLMTLGS